MSETINAKDRLIFALDLPDREAAEGLVRSLEGVVSFFKIGMELYLSAGPDFAKLMIKRGKRIFLDLKFYDVPETVQLAVAAASAIGVEFLTVHGNGRIMSAAIAGKKRDTLKILAVTVLTSLDQDDLNELGYPCSVPDLVLHRARKAKAIGLDGVIASGEEAARIRNAVGEEFLIVSPGIRPGGASLNDHKRPTTPRKAVLSGSDYLVVGRPIRDAEIPRDAALEIAREMQLAFDERGMRI
ncbi:MAG TPA: orotidine-5'-phosphate decarboxylase [Nitrospiria bacterium]|nr:orotidine-5'-phosphate decarboxylase [Nitrospiria bacterium]